MIKRTGFSAANSEFSVGGAFALLAGAGLLVGALVSSQSSQTQKTKIFFDAAHWSYLSAPITAARASVVDEVELGLDDESFATEAQHLTFAHPLVVRPRHHRVKKVTAPVEQVVAHQEVVVATQVPVTTQASQEVADTVTLSAAAIDMKAPEDQLEAFRVMHRQMRAQFFVALRSEAIPVAEQVTTQAMDSQKPVPAVLVTDTAPAQSVTRALATEKHEIRRTHQGQKAIKKTVPSVKSVVKPEMPKEARVVPAIEAPQPVATYAAIREQAQGSYDQIEQLSQQVFASLEGAAVAKAEAAQIEAHPVIASVSTNAVLGAPTSVTTQNASKSSAVTTLAQSGVTVGALKTSSPAGYSHQVEYSTLDLFKMWRAWNASHATAAQAPSTPVAAAQPAPQPVPATPMVLAQQAREVRIAEAPTQASTASDESTGLVPSAPMVVEAFEWNTEVQGSTTRALTLEGWSEVQAADHWSVIHWSPEGQTQAPMISHNTAVMLARLADTQLQPDAAIVFGKIPSGWDVEYSDRSEKVLYLNQQNKPDATAENARYFAFLNAAPGAQLVTLKSSLGAETAAVVVPVLNGTSTFVDLTSVSKRAFSGYVLDASAQTRKGIGSASVEVVGQSNAVFFTTESGYFHLSEVYAVGDYPVYVETLTPNGYKHRYRVTPGKMDGVELYRLGDGQIRGWLSQLEGGVSPESGLIVAAMPSLISSYGDGRLFPSTKSLQANSTLTPETYVLSAAGELQTGAPLEAAAPRFVSVQVPTGPVVSQVEDNNRNVVWSQLVLAQPGVINVVGPY